MKILLVSALVLASCAAIFSDLKTLEDDLQKQKSLTHQCVEDLQTAVDIAYRLRDENLELKQRLDACENP